jgi:STE24 endopeptidase
VRARSALALVLLPALGATLVLACRASPPSARGTGPSSDGMSRGLPSGPAAHPGSGSRGSPASAYFEPAFLRTSLEYNRTQLAYGLNARAIRWAAYLTLLLTPLLTALGGRLARRMPGRENVRVLALSWIVLGIAFLVLFPISIASGFVTEHRYGLSNQSLPAWLADALKSFALSGLVTSLLTVLWFALRRRLPRTGWAVFAAAGVLAAAFSVLIAPILVDPLFYRFHPLADEGLRGDLVEMAKREGIRLDRVLVVEASAKTVRENAYFTGLGRTKRVVLYDNLLANASPAEVRQVFAHELGHWSRDHIVRGLVLWSVAIPVLSWLLWKLHGRLAGWERLGLDGPADPAGIPLVWLLFSVGFFLSEPLANVVSRRFESEADRVALELTDDPATFAESQRRMAVSNLSWVDPPPFVKWMFWTHPTTLERIRAAEEWRAS